MTRCWAGSGNDEVFGGAGRDTLRGQGGRDVFQFTPDDGDRADIIEDFEAGGTTHDLIDLHRLFDALGCTGTTPLSDDIVRVVDVSGGASVRIADGDGGFDTVARVEDVSADDLGRDSIFVTTDTYWFG